MDELEYIVKDALMICDQGGAPDFFKPTSNTQTKIEGLLVATEKDGKPIENIPSFKVCKLKGEPCVPETAPNTWKDVWDIKITGAGGAKPLIGCSTCPCKKGGTIEFLTSGQIPLPDDAAKEVKDLQEQAQRELDDAGYGDSVGETGFVEGMIPVWGSGRDLINDIQTGDGWGIAMNTGFLIWDVASIAAGVFTAGGGTAAMQGGKATLKGVMKQGVKTIARESMEVLGKAGFKKLTKEALKKSLKELQEKLVCMVVRACFPAGTSIHMEFGIKNIEDIKIGDIVKSYDFNENKIVNKRVISVSESITHEILEIQTENEIIRTTPNHPFFVNSGFKDAEQIEAGDCLFISEINSIKVISISKVQEQVKVYNFEVENLHCYFVGDEGILVHNSCLDEFLDILKKLDPNKISHIMQDKHMWELIDVKNWDEAQQVIAKVLKDGTEESYKSVCKKILEVGDEVVEVTYKKMADGSIRVSDAWVKTK